MTRILLIAFGGAIGSVLRYLVGLAAQKYTDPATKRAFGLAFPVGTLAVNLIGCLLTGMLAALFVRRFLPHEQYRLALVVGLMGGFTTFSAFGLDTLTLLQRGHAGLAVFNIAANVAGGLLAVWLGFWLIGLPPATHS